MPNSLINIEQKELITSGISISEHPRVAPLWVNGRNVEFNDGKVRKQKGWTAPFTKPAAAPVRGINQLVKAGVQTLYWGDQSALYKWNSATVTTEGTGYTMPLNQTSVAKAGFWSLVPWGTWMAATNGTNGMLVDKQDTNGFVAMGGTPPTTAEIIIKKGIQLVALNTDLGGTWIEWCADDDLDDWTTGNAGNLNIRDLDSEIKAATALADRIAVYSENTMAILSYPISGFIFGAKLVIEGIGAVSKAAVVTRGNLNYGISSNGVWKTDGVSFEYIDSPRVKKWFLDNVNVDQITKINGVLHEGINCIEWSIPTGTSFEPNVGLFYNFKTNSWGFRNYGRTSQMPRGVFANPYAADVNGYVYQHETGANANGIGMTAYVQSKPFVSRNEDSETVDTLLQYLRLLVDEFADTQASFKIYVGLQRDLNAAISWVEIEKALTSDGKKAFMSTDVDETLYLSLKFISTGLGTTWAISGIELFGDSGGDLE